MLLIRKLSEGECGNPIISILFHKSNTIQKEKTIVEFLKIIYYSFSYCFPLVKVQ